jgi:hypothetical protein
MLKIYPETAFTARANRAFLGRFVGYLAGEAGYWAAGRGSGDRSG